MDVKETDKEKRWKGHNVEVSDTAISDTGKLLYPFRRMERGKYGK